MSFGKKVLMTSFLLCLTLTPLIGSLEVIQTELGPMLKIPENLMVILTDDQGRQWMSFTPQMWVKYTEWILNQIQMIAETRAKEAVKEAVAQLQGKITERDVTINELQKKINGQSLKLVLAGVISFLAGGGIGYTTGVLTH